MCGILGYFSKSQSLPSRDLLETAVDRMWHRGPDERGLWQDERVALGFRRLSIIDLKGGSQPMANETGSLRMVFNGEIYNYRELRKILEPKGHRFQTQSDSEVILHAYEEWGEKCLEKFKGMFAFAIWDAGKSELFMARDRLGKKPLIYTETPDAFIFASEIPPLLLLSGTDQVDSESLGAYFYLRYVPGERTLWKKIHRLGAGSWMKVKRGAVSPAVRYWEASEFRTHFSGTEEEAVDRLKQLLEESVRLRQASDVPLGVFLSGGVDSSVVAAAMSRTVGKMQTFCVGFDDAKYDESSHAREVAQRLGADHHEIRVRPDSLEHLGMIQDTHGEPFADVSILPTHLLSQFTRTQVTVALSGDGGDELFGGYKRYRQLLQANWWGRPAFSEMRLWGSRMVFKLEGLLNPSRRKLRWPRSAFDRILLTPPGERYRRLIQCWDEKEVDQLMGHSHAAREGIASLEIRLEKNRNLSEVERWMRVDLETYLIDDILRKVDMASMACSLECRCPFLDHDFVEFAMSLPTDTKIWGSETKIALKQLYPDLIPPQLFDRPKKGFSFPVGNWMRKQWKDDMEPMVMETLPGEWEKVLNRDTVVRIWKEHLQGGEDHGERLWSWYMFRRWLDRWKPVPA